MAIMQISFFSQVLAKEVGMNVIWPKVGNGPFPVYYLLHGLSDDYTGWQRRTRIEVYAATLPLVVVMPDGYRGFYTDNEEGPPYGKYMADELTAFVEKTFNVQKERSGRCIGGLSMGGYGAIRLAFSRPDLFASVNSHSGPLQVGTIKFNYDPDKKAERTRVFGANPTGSAHDLFALADKIQSHGPLPKLLIDCGTEDGLLNQNRAFHAHLQELGIPHDYAEYPGGHTWDYWDLHVREALQFHATNLGLKNRPVIE